MDILSIRNVKKKFGKTEVLRGIDMCVKEGEIVGFIGPNGAGKTTLMKCISGLIFPDEGSIDIAGHSLDKERNNALFMQSSLIEMPGLFPYMKGIENIKVFAALRNIDQASIQEIIDFMNFSKQDLNKRVQAYSLGMKQRLGLGIALMAKPKLLILDEPTNGLDPSAVLSLRKMLRYLAKEEQTAILFSSHSLGEIEKIADRIICINQGKLVPTPNVMERAISYRLKVDKEITKEEYQNLPYIRQVKKDALGDILVLDKEANLQMLIDEINHKKHCKILEISKIKSDVEDIYKEIYEDII